MRTFSSRTWISGGVGVLLAIPLLLSAEPPAHLVEARSLLRSLTPETNLYTASPSRIVWLDEAGANQAVMNHSVCSSFAALLLRKTYGIDAKGAKTLWGEVAPEADDFYVAMKNSGRFELANSITDIRPGDFLAIDYRSNKAIPTGHVMLVDGKPRRVAEHDSKSLPWPRPTELTGQPVTFDTPTVIEWHVAIIDSSKSPHGQGDTRKGANPDGSDDNGLGRGDLRLLTDTAGQVIGYTWSTSNQSRLRSTNERLFLAGRFITKR